MMTRSQRLILALILLAPTTAMLIYGIVHFVEQVDRVMATPEWIIISEMSRRLRRPVIVGRAIVRPAGTLVLEDVRIPEKPSIGPGDLVVIPRASVHYNFRSLLNGQGASAVSDVALVRPTVTLVRLPDGSFNIAELLKRPPGPPGPPFLGRVAVTGARVVFRDYHVGTPAAPVVTVLHDVDATVDAAREPVYAFHVAAKGFPGRVIAARVNGIFNGTTKLVSMDVNASGVSAPLVARYLGLPKGVTITGGTANATIGIAFHANQRPIVPTITGIVTFANGSVLSPYLSTPITGITGKTALARSRALVDLTGNLAGTRSRVTGTVSNFKKPTLNLVLYASAVEVPAALRAFRIAALPSGTRIAGLEQVTAKIAGPASNPRIEGVARVRSLSAFGYTAENADLSIDYLPGQLVLRSASFRLMGAPATASGVIRTTGKRTLAINAVARGVPVDRLPQAALVPEGISGVADANISITGTVSSPVVGVDATMTGAVIAGQRVAAASGRIEVSKGVARLRGVVARGVAGGSITASGTASRGSLDLNVTANGVEIGQLSRRLGLTGAGGTLYAKGRLTGTASNPRFAGLVEVFNPAFGSYHAQYARAELAGDKTGFKISSGVVRRFPAEVDFTGSVAGVGTDRISFDVAARGSRLRIESLLGLTGSIRSDVTGTVSFDLQASGTYVPSTPEGKLPLVNTVASGNVSLQDGTAFGYVIDTAEAKLQYEGKTLTVTDAVVASQNARLTAGGTVNAESHAVDLTFNMAGFDLARVRERLQQYVSLSGVVGANGSVAGTWDRPVITAAAHIDRLILDGRRFDVATVRGVVADNTITSGQVTLQRGKQVYETQVSGFDLATRCLTSATLKLTDASVPDLWDMARTVPYVVHSEEAKPLRDVIQEFPRLESGTLNASAEMSGCLEHPNGSLQLTATNVGLDIRQIDTITLNATSQEGVVTLNQLHATAGEMSIDATGNPLFAEGRINLNATANNVDLSRLRPWLGDNTPSGVMTVDVVVGGTTTSPQATASVEVVNPGWRGLTFERLRASRIDIGEGKISFAAPSSSIIVASGGHQLEVEGYLPWDWSTLTVPRDRPLEVTADLNNEDLSILGTFSSQVDTSKTTGPLQAFVHMAGTLAAPTVSGSLRVANGSLVLKRFTNSFTNINADLSLAPSGDRVVVNQLTADSSLGGKIYVEPGGYVAIQEGVAVVDMLLAADALKIAERDLLGYRENVSMQVDAGLSISGGLVSPVVANAEKAGLAKGIVISNAALKFVVPEAAPTARPLVLPINPQFQVALQIGPNVRVEPPNMNMLVEGTGSLTGMLGSKETPLLLRAGVSVREGNLTLAASRLRVTPGSTISITYSPPAAPQVVLREFHATTSATAVNSLGERERYQITLNISGPVTNMQISMTSSPAGLTHEQMLAALGHVGGIFGTGQQGLEQEIANALTAVGTSTLFMPIEQLFTERLGFEQFSLEYSPLTPLAIFVSRQLFDSVYVSYYQRLQTGVPSTTDRTFILRVSYRLKGGYQFSIGTDDQQTTFFEIGVTRSFQ